MCTVWTVLSNMERIRSVTGETGTRSRILAAAQELAHELGPARISLDAVAARAGVSKGGLLYHFPSKAKLLEGLVEQFLSRFNCALSDRERELSGEPNSVLRAYLDL